MEEKITDRGFDVSSFIDVYDNECSLQKSSSASEDRIWLGVNNPDPKIMASDAEKLGIDTKGQYTGWIDYDIPSQVSMSTRMHLNQEQVAELLPYLKRFVKYGGFNGYYDSFEYKKNHFIDSCKIRWDNFLKSLMFVSPSEDEW